MFSAAGQLGSEAFKRNCHCEAKNLKGIIEIFENPLLQSHSIKEAAKFFNVQEFVKFLSLLTKRKLFPLASTGRESNCSSATSYSCERGGKKAYSVLSQATVDLSTEYGRCKVANASEINDFVFSKLKKIGSGSLITNDIGYIMLTLIC